MAINPLVSAFFAIFFGCCVAQFWFMRRIRIALVKRHPDVWLRLSGESFWGQGIEWHFAWRRGDRALNDLALTEAVQHYRLLMLIALLAWIGMAASAVALH
jgi:hypothetical protein